MRGGCIYMEAQSGAPSPGPAALSARLAGTLAGQALPDPPRARLLFLNRLLSPATSCPRKGTVPAATALHPPGHTPENGETLLQDPRPHLEPGAGGTEGVERGPGGL